MGAHPGGADRFLEAADTGAELVGLEGERGQLVGGALCRCVTLKPIGPQCLDALLKVWDLLDKSSFWGNALRVPKALVHASMALGYRRGLSVLGTLLPGPAEMLGPRSVSDAERAQVLGWLSPVGILTSRASSVTLGRAVSSRDSGYVCQLEPWHGCCPWR